MKTLYFKTEDRKITVKETNKFIYTRVLNKYNKHIEVKHDKSFFENLKNKYAFEPCTQIEYLTVNNKTILI